MPPSLSRPSYDAAAYDPARYDPARFDPARYDPALLGFGDQRATEDRLPMGAAGAIILGLSVAAWIIVVQAMRMAVAVLG